MKTLLWRDGRFSWPIVATIALLTVSLVVFDFIWRTMTVSFEALMVAAGLALILELSVLLLASKLIRRKTLK